MLVLMALAFTKLSRRNHTKLPYWFLWFYVVTIRRVIMLIASQRVGIASPMWRAHVSAGLRNPEKKNFIPKIFPPLRHTHEGPSPSPQGPARLHRPSAIISSLFSILILSSEEKLLLLLFPTQMIALRWTLKNKTLEDFAIKDRLGGTIL